MEFGRQLGVIRMRGGNNSFLDLFIGRPGMLGPLSAPAV
jgi:hypothetical protein